jgi:glycosyltransferase involved in cell wall biosynthesis
MAMRGTEDNASAACSRCAPDRPRVSVLMPAHDAERTIVDSVASALGQSILELEVIVVDDGSARPVADLLASFDDERLRIVRTRRNRGVAAARNTALAAARAPVVAQLDADDLWHENHLELVLRELTDPSIGLVYSNAEVLGHPRGLGLWIASDSGGRATAVQRRKLAHPVSDLVTLYAGNPIPSPTVAMRTEAARACGGYPDWLSVGEDYVLYIRLMRAGWGFAYVDQATAVYRWPQLGRGATFDRRRHARQEAKLYAVLAVQSPRTHIL